MRNLLAAEVAKTTAGRAWLGLIAGGLFLGGLTVVSQTSQAAAGVVDATAEASITDAAVRYWMTMHLCSAMFGALFVTREYSSRTIGRSVILSGGRARLLGAKMVAATAMGLVFAAVASGVAALAPWVVLPRYDLQPQWTATTSQVLAGVFAVTVLAVPWGVFIGWITRSSTLSIVLLAVTTMAVDPYLGRLVPEVAVYLFTAALASVYLDTSPQLLPVPAALAVIGAWLAVAWAVAHRSFIRRDLP